MKKYSFKTPFKFLWSAFKKSIFMIGLIVTIAYIGAILYISKSKQEVTVDLPEQGFIVDININGAIVDVSPSTRSLALNLINNAPKTFNITRLLKLTKRIEEDKRVKGVMINWSEANSNLSHQTRLNDALTNLRQERPELPIYFYSNNIDRGSLLLSSSANRIAIPPVSNILITGPIMQLTYFGEAAEKLGIGFTVFKTGPHKAVFEPYIRSTPSEEVLTEYQQINQEISADIIQRIAIPRGKSLDEVKAWFKQSIFTTESALTNNIVTDVSYEDDFMDKLQDEAGVYDSSIDSMQYLISSSSLEDKNLSENSTEKLAFINASGAIAHQPSNSGGDNNKIYSNSLIDQIQWAKDDDEVVAVVLRVSSPGGSAQASELIWHHLNQLAQEKPLVVSMGSVAASGGYYIATPAQKIVAESTTITGSIGVTAVLPEIENLQEKIGVYFHTISDSDRKSLLSIEEKPSELDVSMVEAGIQETYKTFLDRVVQGRPLSFEEAEKIAGGRIYTGTTAQKLGLVDEIGDTDTAFRIAKELSGLNPDKLYPIKPYTYKSKNILNCLIQQGLENCVTLNSFELNPLQASIEKFTNFTALFDVLELTQADGHGPKQLTYIPLQTDL